MERPPFGAPSVRTVPSLAAHLAAMTAAAKATAASERKRKATEGETEGAPKVQKAEPPPQAATTAPAAVQALAPAAGAPTAVAEDPSAETAEAVPSAAEEPSDLQRSLGTGSTVDQFIRHIYPSTAAKLLEALRGRLQLGGVVFHGNGDGLADMQPLQISSGHEGSVRSRKF